MAHYALLDNNNFVIDVITGVDENDKTNLPEEFSSWEEFYAKELNVAKCKRTSFNTSGNEHVLGGTAFRGNYAGVGYTYNEENDVFIGPKPTENHELNEKTWLWQEKE